MGAQTIQKGESQTIEERFISVLIYIDHSMVFTLGCGQFKIDDAKTYTYFAGNFDCHGDVTVQCGVHHPIEHIPRFTSSHWMLPVGKCLGCIAPEAAMVNDLQ